MFIDVKPEAGICFKDLAIGECFQLSGVGIWMKVLEKGMLDCFMVNLESGELRVGVRGDVSVIPRELEVTNR